MKIPNESFVTIKLFTGELPKIRKIALEPVQEEDWDVLVSFDFTSEFYSSLNLNSHFQKTDGDNFVSVIFAKTEKYPFRLDLEHCIEN